jgi:HSP20 family protein
MAKKNQNNSSWRGITKLNLEDLDKTTEKVEVAERPVRAAKAPLPPGEEKSVAKNKGKKEKEAKPAENTDQWFSDEEITGQLSIDLYDAGDSLIIESTVAGVQPEDIDISAEPDLITIRGKRKKDREVAKKNYFYQECFWGSFARTVVLPTTVKPDGVRANIKNGILIVILPKAEEKIANIKVK